MLKINYLSIEEAKEIHLATIRNSGGGETGELDIGKRVCEVFSVN